MYEIPGLDVVAPVLDAYARRSFYFLCSETIELSANLTMNERFFTNLQRGGGLLSSLFESRRGPTPFFSFV